MLTPSVRELAHDEKLLAHRRTNDRVRHSLQLHEPRPPKRPREVRTTLGTWVNEA